MKILLVDDEPMQLRLTRKLIEDIAPDSEAHTAQSGAAALAMLAQESYDLLITDIKMPGQSGLEVIRQIRGGSLNRTIMIAVLSGYGEFVYAQTAIQYGALSYLLKPVSKRDLEDLLNSVRQRMRDQSKADAAMSGDVHRTMVEHAFFKLFSQLPMTDEERGLLWSGGQDSRDHYILAEASPGQDGVEERLAEVFAPSFSFRMAPALVLHIFSHSGSNAAEKIKVALEPIRESLRCGLSLPHPAAEYYAAFGEATMAAEALFFAPDARLMQYSPARRNEELERQWIRELSASLLKPNDDGISAAFARLAEYCRESFLGKEDLERALLLVVDEQMAGCVRYFSNERVSANHHLHYIRLIKEAPSLRRMLETMLAFGASLRRISGIEGSPLHENYRLYIQNNLNTVTLNAMAKEFNYNPTYFSKHFSGVFGQSFKDYLLDARLEKAKELLEKTDLKIYEITERVGFKAPAHFIKVFREQLSLSPKQYRIALDKRRRDCGEGDDRCASSGREPPPNHP